MMSKKYIHDDIDLSRPQDCLTLKAKVAYSMMLAEAYERIVCDYNAPPSALSDFHDKYPYNPTMPWTHPELATEWARKERAWHAIMRLLPDDE
jgi:hypothetical protein